MLLFLFITLAIGLILFFDGYKKEMKKGVDKEFCIKSTEKGEKRKNIFSSGPYLKYDGSPYDFK